ncbi:MAG: acetate--CoA ligase family protein [Candidatus Taylorbacteria bacterium]|nr:acetate--CoA ligase family protein [Candidatus Taylorbacteria bacterium]
MDLIPFFNPKSVAIIGASSDKNKVGYALMANLLNTEVKPQYETIQSQFTEVKPQRRAIYPISLSEKEILGLKTFSSLNDIPASEKIDLALIAVRADIVPQVLTDCGERGIKNVTIISAGFREVGESGIVLENRLKEIAQKYGIALLGPNCLGTIDFNASFNSSFGPQPLMTENGSNLRSDLGNRRGLTSEIREVRPWPAQPGFNSAGSIAFLSQSGALGTSLLDMAAKEGVGFSKFISLGNEAFLTEIEFLEYLADDDDTKAILIYLEKLSDGRKFMELVSKITQKKPVVVLKAGRSERGMRAVMSHTGSLAPDSAVFAAALKQSGAIAVESIREFFNMAKLFELGVFKPLRNLIVLTNGGGPSVVTADLIDLSRSLSMAELSIPVKQQLQKVLPPMAAVGNPVDIIGDALSARYEEALKILTMHISDICIEPPFLHISDICKNGGSTAISDSVSPKLMAKADTAKIDAIILMLTPQMMTEVEATAKLISQYRNKKPIIPVFLGGPTIKAGLEYFKQNGLINFNFPKDAVEALDNLTVAEVQPLQTKTNPQRFNLCKPSITEVQPLRMLSYEKTYSLLKDNSLSLDGILVKEKSKLISAISKLGKGPFAMKVISADIVHKTDSGAVVLNVKSLEEANVAWDSMMAKLEVVYRGSTSAVEIEGILVQRMGAGREVIIGMKRDSTFGPTILFGLGGIMAEAIKDTSLRVAPIDEDEALNMMHEIKGISILNGMRGEKAVDFEALANILVNLSRLVMEHSEIKEIDFNPVMVTDERAVIVDARVMV